MKCHNCEAQFFRGKKRRRDEEQTITKQTPNIKPLTHKHKRTATEERHLDGQQKNKYWGLGFNQFYMRKTSPLILMPLHSDAETEIINLICEPSQ